MELLPMATIWAKGQHQVSEGEPYDLILTLQAGEYGWEITQRREESRKDFSLFSVDNSLSGFTGTNGAIGGTRGRGAREEEGKVPGACGGLPLEVGSRGAPATLTARPTQPWASPVWEEVPLITALRQERSRPDGCSREGETRGVSSSVLGHRRRREGVETNN